MDPNSQNSPYKPTPQTPHYVDHDKQAQPLQTPVYGEQPGAPQPHEYEFIMNPEKPHANRGLPGGSSVVIKALYGLGSLLVLFAVLTIGSKLLSGGNNFTQFIGVAATQQELITIADDATSQSSLPTKSQEFLYTAELGLTSAQSDVITYLVNNKQKVGVKQLASKTSATTQSQLTAAVTDGTYDTVFKEIMKTKLTAYQTELQATYDTTKGPKGKELLSKQYDQAGLLLKQLEQK